MRLANNFVYANMLKQGYTTFTRLRLPRLAHLRALLGAAANNWLLALLDPMRDVVFVDTDDVPAREGVSVASSSAPAAAAGGRGESERSHSNSIEAELIAQTVKALVLAGASAHDIGVICPFRAQTSVLKHHLGGTLAAQVEVATVDSFQGKDKEVIMISFVRSNQQQHVCAVSHSPHTHINKNIYKSTAHYPRTRSARILCFVLFVLLFCFCFFLFFFPYNIHAALTSAHTNSKAKTNLNCFIFLYTTARHAAEGLAAHQRGDHARQEEAAVVWLARHPQHRSHTPTDDRILALFKLGMYVRLN